MRLVRVAGCSRLTRATAVSRQYCPPPALARKSATDEICCMRERITLLIAVLTALTACRHRPDRDGAASMPGYAPDSTPLAVQRALRRSDNVLVDPPGISGRVVKNALYVRFTDWASEREQNAALRAASAVVIGGMRMKGGQLYHIRIDVPSDSGSGPLLRARETLRTLPQVQLVLFDVVGPTP